MKYPLLDVEELRKSLNNPIQWKEGVDPSKVDINEQLRLFDELSQSADRMFELAKKHIDIYLKEQERLNTKNSIRNGII
jgi:hypothetical protein